MKHILLLSCTAAGGSSLASNYSVTTASFLFQGIQAGPIEAYSLENTTCLGSQLSLRKLLRFMSSDLKNKKEQALCGTREAAMDRYFIAYLGK